MTKVNQQILRAAYTRISEKERQCLLWLFSKWCEVKPLQGKKVLLHYPIKTTTLVIIDYLIAAGADVEIAFPSGLEINEKTDAFTAIQKSGIIFYRNEDVSQEKHEGYYDVLFSYNASLLSVIAPKDGAIELGYANPILCGDLNYPVINIGCSKTATTQTELGVGDGVKRMD